MDRDADVFDVPVAVDPVLNPLPASPSGNHSIPYENRRTVPPAERGETRLAVRQPSRIHDPPPVMLYPSPRSVRVTSTGPASCHSQGRERQACRTGHRTELRKLLGLARHELLPALGREQVWQGARVRNGDQMAGALGDSNGLDLTRSSRPHHSFHLVKHYELSRHMRKPTGIPVGRSLFQSENHPIISSNSPSFAS